MAAGNDALDILRSIDATLKTLLVVLTPKKPVRVDLDGQYGDPEIKTKAPRDWTGPSMVGRHMSECPPDYLDMIAERCDYFADKNERDGDEKKAKYARLDGARARGWAERLRSGYVKPTATEPSGFDETPEFDSGF